MTPAQQAALEGVAGRSLTADELAAIDLLLPARNDVAIAALLSTGRTTTDSTLIGIGTILAVMAPAGGDFLDAIEALGATDANAKWTLRLIERGSFDVGHPVARQQMLAFAADHPPLATAIDALLAVAARPDPIPFGVVSDALNVAEGRLTLGGV